MLGKAKWKGPPVAIIGGGLSGLACGLALKRRGIRAVVFDTGRRGPGGRASSRILKTDSGRYVVDHAVQAFTAEAPEVCSLVAEMERAGAVRRWAGRLGSLRPGGGFREREESEEGPLWIGNEAEGMGAMAEWLAGKQEVKKDVWVARMAQPKTGSGAWELQDRNRKRIGDETYSYVVMAHNGKCADRLIKTAPMRTDAHAPLRCKFTPEPSASTTDRLELSSLWVCVIAAPHGAAGFDGAFVEGDEVLSWAGNNASKYPGAAGKNSAEAWTLISTPRFGTANKCAQEFIPDNVRKKVSDKMRAAFGALLGTDASGWEVLHLQLWGAALPLNTCPQHFVHDPVAHVGICGDWLTSPSVEGALFSGLALAGAVEQDLVADGMPATGVLPFHGFAGGHAIGSFGTGGASLNSEEVVESAKAAAEASASTGAGADGTDGRKWNFAFGANINPWKLRNRRGINPVEQVAGYLPGWRLVFNHSGGMGNIEPLPEEPLQDGTPDAVHGMLLLLEPQDFDKLSAMEHEYKTEEVMVKAYDGRTIKALAYVSPPDYKLRDYPRPPERYIKLIRRGASDSRLDTSYQQWLRKIEGVEDRGPEYWDHPGSSRRQQQTRRRWRQRA